MACKARVGPEWAGRPFPHLTPAEACRRFWHAISEADRGDLPLCFGRQAPPGPAAPSFGFEIRQVNGRTVKVKGLPRAEVLGFPGAALQFLRTFAQVTWRSALGVDVRAATFVGQPCPAAGRPPACVGVAPGFYERQKLSPSDQLGVDLKGRYRYLVGAQLIVKREPFARVAQLPGLSGKSQGVGPFGKSLVERNPARARGNGQIRWQGDAQRLSGVRGGLRMHVFVEQHQAVKVKGSVVLRGAGQVGQQVQRIAQDRGHVAARGVQVRQGKRPAHRMRNFTGVVHAIGLLQAAGRALMLGVTRRAQRALPVAGNPVGLKPRDMADLPQRWVELGGVRHGQRRPQSVLVGLQQPQGAHPAGLQQFAQRAGVTGARRSRVDQRREGTCVVSSKGVKHLGFVSCLDRSPTSRPIPCPTQHLT